MADDTIAYATTGIPYYVRTVHSYQTLIGLAETDYRVLLSLGFQDEEVYLSLRKKTSQGPLYDLEVRAGLNTIKIDGDPFFQLCLDGEPTRQLRERGYKDGQEVGLYIKRSPYKLPSRQINAEDVAIDIFNENDPMLDEPAVWL